MLETKKSFTSEDSSTETENMESIKKLKKNTRIYSLNPTIFGNLLDSERVFSSSFNKYAVLLECVDFDRVYLSIKFLVDMTPEDVASMGGINEYFSRYRNHTFWREFQPGSLSKQVESANEILIDLLKTTFKLARFKIAEHAKALFYRDRLADDTITIEMIDDFNYDDFRQFLLTLFAPYLKHRYSKAIVEFALEDMVSNGTSDNIIQFLDCYVEDGRVYEGMHPTVGRFLIRRKVYDAIKNRKPTKVVREVDELIAHLCDYDEKNINLMTSILATVFLNDSEMKNTLSPHLRIFGPSGANGKTTFEELLRKAFGNHNVVATQIGGLDNYHFVETTVQSLIAVDGDSSGKSLSSDAAATFKRIVTGDTVRSRQIYGKMRDVKAMCLLLAFCNTLPKSSDKSNAFLRRMTIVKCSDRLTESRRFIANDEWFKNLRSDVAAQYLVEKLLLKAQDMLDQDTLKLPEASKATKDMLTKFSEENDSASAWIKEVGIEEIVGYQVKEVREKYEAWCEENDKTPLKRQFNEILEVNFGLERRKVTYMRLNPDSSYHALSKHKGGAAVNAWQFEDAKKNARYFKKLEQI